MKMTTKERQARIHRRIRGRVSGSAERPRLAVFRSNKGSIFKRSNQST